MEVELLTEYIQKYCPIHYKRLSRLFRDLGDELKLAKADLTKDLVCSQNENDFLKAREILYVQEELAKRIEEVQAILEQVNLEKEKTVSVSTADNGNLASSLEQSYSDSYDVGVAVACDLKNAPVTFRKPVAFSYNGNCYSVHSWRAFLLKICEILYQENPSIMMSMTDEGEEASKKRVKLSRNGTGMISPANITGSNLWIETQRNAGAIKKAVLVLLECYGVPTSSVNIYFNEKNAEPQRNDTSIQKTVQPGNNEDIDIGTMFTDDEFAYRMETSNL